MSCLSVLAGCQAYMLHVVFRHDAMHHNVADATVSDNRSTNRVLCWGDSAMLLTVCDIC